MAEPAHNHLSGDGTERLCAFIVEREAVRLRRAAGQAWPWTSDGILQLYRFCNVRREDDAVTTWIRDNWRKPHYSYEDLWHLMCVARLLNNVETLEAYELNNNNFPVWHRRALDQVMHARKINNARVFNPAYMITTAGKKQDKQEYICDLLDTLWSKRKGLRPRAGDTLSSWHMLLGAFDGLGSFLAGQVVADMRYVEPLVHASDWQGFACSGPGSRRGLARVMGKHPHYLWTEEDWRRMFDKLQVYTTTALQRQNISLHGQDLQNCLCEFDKYERARLGEGRPKQLYRRPR